ncbi:MAG TPA: TIGR02757 family protein [Thermoanaerobaculia bacterium]|nr:TIGR02757 family protein [Thermoanaerobaculia bacterium]
MLPVPQQLLKRRLDRLVETFDLSTLHPDPLELPRRYGDPRDQEVAALLAAAFAYGRAATVVENIGTVLDRMGPSPWEHLRGFDPRTARRRFSGFSHRFHKSADLVALLGCLAAAIRERGTLGALFESSYGADDEDIGPSLSRFVARLIAFAPRRRPSLHYLLTSPEDGSACKRMNLFLRWMIRREEPDLGLWRFADPAKLVVPLDTHIHRITGFLGMHQRKSADWKTARAVTDHLLRLDPADPVRYDFAICRLGILDLCSRRQRKELCDVCLLRDVCRLRVNA